MDYAGDVTPAEAYAAVTGADDALLVDVRTRAEWTYVGVPELAADALTAAGLGPAYNVLEGFEGPPDAAGHRTVSGWRNSGLPWRQG